MAKKDLVIKTPKGTVTTVGGKNGMKAVIEWNPGFGPKTTNAFQGAQAMFDSEVLRLCDKYTPKDTGMLITSAQISSEIGDGRLVWNTPYAAAQYFSKREPGSQTGALRGPYWGDRMKHDKKTHLERFVRSAVGRGM